MKTTKMTVTEFAKKVGKTTRAIQVRLRNNQPIKGVVSVERFGKFWLLEVEEEN